MDSVSTEVREDWRSFSTHGSEARLERGVAITARSASDCPPYWFSGNSTIILGATRRADEEPPSETIATWNIHVDAGSIHHFRRGFLVVACLRYFGGLHSYRRDSRADIFVNDQQIDGFALRVRPPDHSDYFHRLPVPELPSIWPLSGCQTIYTWPLRKENLNSAGHQRVTIRIDKDVRWDIDYVAFLLQANRASSRLFLSHSWKDKDVARRLASALSARGIGVWLDEAEIKLGDSLIEKIREAIDTVEYVLVLLSRSSVGSEWVRREVDIAMNQEIDNKRVKVLPVLLDECDLPGFLKGKLYADLRSPDEFDKVIGMIESRLRS